MAQLQISLNVKIRISINDDVLLETLNIFMRNSLKETQLSDHQKLMDLQF